VGRTISQGTQLLREVLRATRPDGRRPGGAAPIVGGRVAQIPARATRGAPGIGRVAFGLGAAQACFAFTFRGPRDRFWDRMTLTGLALGGYALLARPTLGSTRIRPAHVVLGAASAAALYATFEFGDRFARRYVPSGQRDIAEIYALRDLRPRGEIAARLVTVIGPAEELFWRGLVQSGLMARYGRWRGAALAAAAYGGVHMVTGNFTLFGAAGIAGTHWCVLYAAGVPLGALIVSHQLWDVWIFLVQPTGATRATAVAG
jgi:membrane protease YdiL (CAAX protease family)